MFNKDFSKSPLEHGPWGRKWFIFKFFLFSCLHYGLIVGAMYLGIFCMFKYAWTYWGF